MTVKREELKQILSRAIGEVAEKSAWDRGELAKIFVEVFDEYEITDALYVPDPAFLRRLDEYNLWYTTHQSETQGKMMEELALLAFKGLQCHPRFESFESTDDQHDLVITFNSNSWVSLLKYWGFQTEFSIVLVEAKNTKKPVSVEQFAHLCSVIQNKFTNTSHLAVFFSRSSASGFPPRNVDSKKRALKYAWAKQVIFRAKTNKFVIVFDHYDLQFLSKVGSLPKLIKHKIAETERITGLDIFEMASDFEVRLKQTLPSHLQKYIDAN